MMERKRTLKNIRLAGIILFVVLSIIFGVHLISGFLKVLPYSYSPITNQESKYLNLFNDSTKNELAFKHAFGSKDDTLVVYEYKDLYRLTIWKLERYNNVVLSNISLDKNQEIKKIENEQYNEMLIGGEPPLNFMVQSVPNNSDFIKIKLSNESELKEMLESSSYRNYYMRVTEIGLCYDKNAKECNLIYSFGDACNVDLMFYRKKEKFFIILLNPLNNNSIEDNLLIKMLE